MTQPHTVILVNIGSGNGLLPDGPLARCVKLWAAHAPAMPGTFSPPPRVSDPDMHHGTCVTHVPWCMPGSLTSGFLWSRWRGKRSRHSRRKRIPQFYVSGKRPMVPRHHHTWWWFIVKKTIRSPSSWKCSWYQCSWNILWSGIVCSIIRHPNCWDPIYQHRLIQIKA